MQKMTYEQRIKALRLALVEKYGKRNYKIDKGDDVHVYSPMPNSNIVGWWYMGCIDHACDWMGIERHYTDIQASTVEI